ncbi:MAG: SDR family oxidoreductase [Pseudomonadota bacterium]
MIPLHQQNVVITGAAMGLGAGIARVFARAGAKLLLMDRAEEPLRHLAEETGNQAIAVDLADAHATAEALASLPERVDTLIHNAGILRVEPIEALTLESFRAQLDVGIQAAYQLTRAVWPGMAAQSGGALIFVSSQSGIKGFVDESAYCAAKHALEGFSKCLAIEGAAHGILSCTITPGKPMHTPMSDANYTDDLKAQWIEPIRLAPAFARIAETRDPAFSGERLNAWQMAGQAEEATWP